MPMTSSAPNTRDRGFALVGRLNRWLIAGAIALSGGLSVAAANAFHGRTRGPSGSTSNAGAVSHHSASSSSGSSGSSSNSGAGGLQRPAQAPSSASASPGGGVVSGGS
jgi:hypothetical protein